MSGEVASDTLRQVGEAIRTGNDCAMFVPDDPKVMSWLKAAQATMPKGEFCNFFTPCNRSLHNHFSIQRHDGISLDERRPPCTSGTTQTQQSAQGIGACFLPLDFQNLRLLTKTFPTFFFDHLPTK